MKKVKFGLVFLIVLVLIACSTTKKNELDRNVKIFLADFQSKLNGSDEGVLKLFATSQRIEEISKAISILQNKDTTVVKVKILFDEATGAWESTYLKVEVPLELTGRGRPVERNSFKIALYQRDARFRIAGLEAEDFYRRYTSLRNEIENAGEIARQRTFAKQYYDHAEQLQTKCDSVIWFVRHGDEVFYYGVNGTYQLDSLEAGSLATYKMGLFREDGKIIVPLEYDLIGTPSMTLAEAVEIRKDGKIGFYSLNGKEIVPPSYDWLVPFNEGLSIALVKNDSSYGWLDKNYTYHDNFPSPRAEKWVTELTYLTSDTLRVGNGYQDVAVIMFPWTEEFQYRGNGLVIPPAYLVANGIFPLVKSGFITPIIYNTEGATYQYGNDFMESTVHKLFSFTDKLDAFISDFRTRFVGGRGEFYVAHKITLVDKNLTRISSVTTDGDRDFEFRKVKEGLYESKFNNDYMGPSDLLEQNFPDYNYFRFDGSAIYPLNSNRRFSFTEFIKIDSSYFVGDFRTFNMENSDSGTSTFTSDGTLRYIRNEILATYGFILSDPKDAEQFKYAQWYKPTVDSYDEVYNKASEIDKYNLDFLNRMIGSPGAKSM
jgi:hypothetical protein